jgi:tetratricopeptide (TPR) repeat protein
MKKLLIILVLFQVFLGFAQNAVHFIDEGNSTYEAKKYIAAEDNYRLSVAKTDTLVAGQYDLANAIYKQKRLNEAGTFYQKAVAMATTKPEKAKAYHNLGNVYFQKNKLEEAIEAYKNALRNNPSDEETRYNLALAKELLKKQQKNQKNQDKKDDKKKDDKKKDDKKKDDKKKDNKKKDNKKKDDKKKDDKKKEDKKKEDKKKDDKKKDDKKKDDKKKDDKKKDDKKKDDKKKDDKKKDDKKKDDDKKDGDKDKKKDKENPNGDKKNQPKAQRAKLSPQQAKRILAAMQNEENKTQKKVKAQQVKGVRVQTEKDW